MPRKIRNRFDHRPQRRPFLCRKDRSPRHDALAGAPPRYVRPPAGFEPAFHLVRSIRFLTIGDFRGYGRNRNRPRGHASQTKYPASSPPETERQISKPILSRRSRLWRAAEANPDRFALPSVSGFRLVPSAQAPRFGRARSLARAPGSWSPVPASAGGILRSNACAGENKKPSGAALGRVRDCGRCRFALSETAPMSRAPAVKRQIAVQLFGVGDVDTAMHHTTHVPHAHHCASGGLLGPQLLQVKLRCE